MKETTKSCVNITSLDTFLKGDHLNGMVSKTSILKQSRLIQNVVENNLISLKTIYFRTSHHASQRL